MTVRNANMDDIEQIMEVYCLAKQYMVDSGNTTQWVNGYPSREMIEKDIDKQQFYVCEEEGQIHGAFMFVIGEEPTYKVIEHGAWRNEDTYGTIHRLGSDGKCKGIFQKCLSFCRERNANLRADTHKDNRTMQHLLEKYGFTRCGIIYVADESPRIAYQLSDEEE